MDLILICRADSQPDRIVASSPAEADGTSGTQGKNTLPLFAHYADAGAAGNANKAKRARTARTGTVLRPQPEPEPQEDEQQEEGDEKKDGGLEPGEKVPICTTWRMPKEKEPTGPINYTESSDIVRSIYSHHLQSLIFPQHCYLCQNGGHLIACDEPYCRRVVCLSHVPKIQALPKVILEGLHFRCPSCHGIKTRADAKQEGAEEEQAMNAVKKKPTTGNRSTGMTAIKSSAQKAKRSSGQVAPRPSVPEQKQGSTQKGKLPPKDRPATPYYVRP